MALFETLSAMLTGKVAAAAATLTIVSGTAAGATGTLPQGLQNAFDDVAGVENTEPTDDVETLETDADLEEPTETVTDDTTTDPIDEVTDEPSDEVTDEPSDEVIEDDAVGEDAGTRSDKATQVLTELGDGCMPEDDDCDFGQAVAENARETGAEASAEGKAKAEEHKARRGAPTETPDETATTDASTDETADASTGSETEDAADVSAPEPTPDSGEAVPSTMADGADQDDPGASQRPDHAGR